MARERALREAGRLTFEGRSASLSNAQEIAMQISTNARDARARRLARRLGLTLHKWRRDGNYYVCEPQQNAVLSGPLDLDGVDEWLTEYRSR